MNKFLSAIRGKQKISVIAEIKLASPSHREFGKHDVPSLVSAYEKGGASAISVVTAGGAGTDIASKFQGSLNLLNQVKKITSLPNSGKNLPILRKDFLHDTTEIEKTAACGASAVLLIANILSADRLKTLAQKALQQGLIPLIELHNADDLNKLNSLNFQPEEIIIGINNRDLKTLKTDVNHALKLISKIDPRHIIIAESAFKNAEDLTPYQNKIDAVLVGTALLTAQNPLLKLSTFTQPKSPLIKLMINNQ